LTLSKLANILICLTLAFLSCKPKSTISPNPTSPSPYQPIENSLFICKDLGQPPPPFGWIDSLTNNERTVNTFMFNPLNLDEMVISVNGFAQGSNRLYCFNIRTGKKVFLAETDSYTPDVNKNGWVIYSNSDGNIYKIKCSGDSVTQLTSNKATRDPKWDYTGNNFYFYQTAYWNVPEQLIYSTATGTLIAAIPAFLPNSAPFKTKNKVIYQRIRDNSVTLTLRNMDNSSELPLISAPYTINQIYFNDLVLDNKDENFYWSNTFGIYKCSLTTLKIDTVFKSCPSVTYLNPVFQKSHPNEVLVGCHFATPVLTSNIYHRYLPVQANLVTQEKKILDVFGVLVD
jgi:hypothetical protein